MDVFAPIASHRSYHSLSKTPGKPPKNIQLTRIRKVSKIIHIRGTTPIEEDNLPNITTRFLLLHALLDEASHGSETRAGAEYDHRDGRVLRRREGGG
jgi:hypothetical protein